MCALAARVRRTRAQLAQNILVCVFWTLAASLLTTHGFGQCAGNQNQGAQVGGCSIPNLTNTTALHQIKIGRPRNFADVRTTIRNPSVGPVAFDVCYFQAEVGSLIANPDAQVGGDEAGPKITLVKRLGSYVCPGNGEIVVCSGEAGPGVCNGFSLHPVGSTGTFNPQPPWTKAGGGDPMHVLCFQRICAFRAFSNLKAPRTTSPGEFRINIGNGAGPFPPPAMTISTDLSNAPAGTTVVTRLDGVPTQTIPSSSLPQRKLDISVSVPNAPQGGTVRLSFTAVGSSEPFSEFDLDIAGIGLGQPSSVVINEFHTGTPDHVELRNITNQAIDVGGWTVQTYYGLAPGAGNVVAEPSYTLPAGTVLASDDFLVLEEFGVAGAPGALPNSIRTGQNYFWVAHRTVEIILFDEFGNCRDYVLYDAFANHPTGNLPTGCGWLPTFTCSGTNLDSKFRTTNDDRDSASDWCDGTGGGTPGTYNLGQGPLPSSFVHRVSCGFNSIELQLGGGSGGNPWMMALALVLPERCPAGWFGGIELTPLDFNFLGLISGVLSPAGTDSVVLPGILCGRSISIDCVALEFTPSGSFVQFSNCDTIRIR